MSDTLYSATSAARSLASMVAAIRGLAASGASKHIVTRLHVELNKKYPAAFGAIAAAAMELRRLRGAAVRFGDVVAPTAHEAAVVMLYALNRELLGVEIVSRKLLQTWPDADEVLAEITLEHTWAIDAREKVRKLNGDNPTPAPSDKGRAAPLKQQSKAEGGEPLAAAPPAAPEAPPTARHSADFRSVHWFGAKHSFTPTQAACVKLLWEAWENRTPEVGQEWILQHPDVESESKRLVDLFKVHAAWGTMIVKGRTDGSFRLAGEPLAG